MHRKSNKDILQPRSWRLYIVPDGQKQFDLFSLSAHKGA